MKLPNGTISIRRAFSLIELMVVIGIIVIVIAIAIPALNSITKGNDAVQAQNMLSSLISNARSTAISQGRIAGLILYEEHVGKGAQTTAAFAVEDRNSPGAAAGNLYLLPTAAGTRQRLPAGAKVADLNANNQMSNGDPTTPTNPRPRIILFDSFGQMILRENIFLSASTTPQIGQPTQDLLNEWIADFNTPAVGGTGWSSTPALLIYSQDEFDRAGMTGQSPASQDAWMRANGKVLVINAYTGTVIR